MSVLTLLHYYKTSVGIERLELSTFRVSGECSNQLSYIPMLYRWLDLNQRALRPKRSEIDRTPLHLYFVIGPGLEPKLIESKSIVLTNYTIRQFERVTGFEPATSYLEGTHSTNWATPAFALFENYDIPTPSLTVMCSTSELKKHIYKKTPNFSVRGFLILFKNYYILSYIRIL